MFFFNIRDLAHPEVISRQAVNKENYFAVWKNGENRLKTYLVFSKKNLILKFPQHTLTLSSILYF